MEENKQASYKEYIDRKINESPKNHRLDIPTYALSAVAHYLRRIWVGVGEMESEYLRGRLDKVTPEKAIYISGLARSGTTVTLNYLYKTGQFGSLTYRHYPFIYFPFIWQKIMSLSRNTQEKERAHFDRIRVSIDSPEALEETLWMHFFPKSFQEDENYPPNENTKNKDFEKYYNDFIKKILLISGKNSYLAKGNYNLARLPYILKANKDAKFIICLREPLSHIASLMKQHYLFCKIENQDKRLKDYMDWIGHKEFGLNRQPIYLGNPEEYRKITECWDNGKEIEGWAIQWKYTYNFIYEKILKNPEMSERVYVLIYKNLCADPHAELAKVNRFCAIEPPQDFQQTVQNIRAPDYYDLPFTQEEEKKILAITEETKTLICKQCA